MGGGGGEGGRGQEMVFKDSLLIISMYERVSQGGFIGSFPSLMCFITHTIARPQERIMFK